MSEPGRIKVEVAYALPDKQAIVALEVAEGTTALEAARLSGISDRFGGLDLESARLGIWARVVSPAQALRGGDRVEIYRPLIADPREVRKERAARARQRRSGGER